MVVSCPLWLHDIFVEMLPVIHGGTRSAAITAEHCSQSMCFWCLLFLALCLLARWRQCVCGLPSALCCLCCFLNLSQKMLTLYWFMIAKHSLIYDLLPKNWWSTTWVERLLLPIPIGNTCSPLPRSNSTGPGLFEISLPCHVAKPCAPACWCLYCFWKCCWDSHRLPPLF